VIGTEWPHSQGGMGPVVQGKHKRPGGNSQCSQVHSETKVKRSQQGDANGSQLSREKYRTGDWLLSKADSNSGCQPDAHGNK